MQSARTLALVLTAAVALVAADSMPDTAADTLASPRSSCPLTAGSDAGPDGSKSLDGSLGEISREVKDVRADQSGMVISDVEVSGSIIVTKPGVVIDRVRLVGPAVYGIVVRDGGSVQVSNSQIDGKYSGAGIIGNNVVADCIEIRSVTNDGIKAGSNTVISRSLIHDFRPSPEAHVDGIQIESVVQNVRISDNWIDGGIRPGANSAVFIQADVGDDVGGGPITVERNVLGGGGYALYSSPGRRNKRIADVVIRNNVFLSTSVYGPVYPRFYADQYELNRTESGAVVSRP